MTRETEFGKTDALGDSARARAEQTGAGNCHIAAAELDALAADVSGLPSGMREARKAIAKADEERNKAESKLREEIAAANQFVNLCAEIRVLKNEIATAQTALAEYQFTLDNAAQNFTRWPGLVIQNNGHFGSMMREMAMQIATAREMVPLITDWLPSAQQRLATLEKEAATFAKAHGLKHENAPATN